jgi:hypothetical protein
LYLILKNKVYGEIKIFEKLGRSYIENSEHQKAESWQKGNGNRSRLFQGSSLVEG